MVVMPSTKERCNNNNHAGTWKVSVMKMSWSWRLCPAMLLTELWKLSSITSMVLSDPFVIWKKKKDDNLIEVITVLTWSLSPNATLVCCCKFTGKLGEAWEERPQMSRTDCGLLLPCFQALWLKRNPSTILNAHSVLSARPDDHETSSAGAMLVCAQQNLRV